jgi:hypothetical protein
MKFRELMNNPGITRAEGKRKKSVNTCSVWGGRQNRKYIYIYLFIMNLHFFGATVPGRPGPPHSRDF